MFDFLVTKRLRSIGYCVDLLRMELQGDGNCYLHIQTDWSLKQNGVLLLSQDDLNTAVQCDLRGDFDAYGQFVTRVENILSAGLQNMRVQCVQVLSNNLLLTFEGGYFFETVGCSEDNDDDEWWRVIDKAKDVHYVMYKSGVEIL